MRRVSPLLRISDMPIEEGRGAPTNRASYPWSNNAFKGGTVASRY
jgi:hypothetical protein